MLNGSHQDDQAVKPEVPRMEWSRFCRSWCNSMWFVQAGTDWYVLRVASAAGQGYLGTIESI